jgi:hypothetical protein
LGDKINSIRKNTKPLTDTHYEADLAVNTEKIKYMLLSRHKNAGQNYNTNLLSSHLLSKKVKIIIYKSVLLYGCKTWSLTLKKQLRMRVLRRIFGGKRDAVVGGWRRLHNEDIHKLCSSAIRTIELKKDG